MEENKLNEKFGALLDVLENDFGVIIKTTEKDYRNGVVEITGFIRMNHEI